MSDIVLTHQFVDYIPDHLEDGRLYVSMKFATAVHKCVCGCGREVVTPFSPTDWELTFDGRTISLDPSIGNWNYPCQSHYWIKRSRVRWAPKWSRERIAAGRAVDGRLIDGLPGDIGEATARGGEVTSQVKPHSIWHRIKALWS